MKRILIATDGSPSSTEAVAFGVELAAEHAAELIVVHVVPTLDVAPAIGFGLGFGGAFPHDVTEHDRTMLEEAAAVAAEHEIVSTTAMLPWRHGGRNRRLRRLARCRPDRRRIARPRRDRRCSAG